MQLKTKAKLSSLAPLSTSQLREKYAEIFGEPTRSQNRRWILRRIAWRLQSLDEGSLSSRALKRARELACEQDLRLRAPAAGFGQSDEHDIVASLDVPQSIREGRDPRLPLPGQVIPRKYKGRTHLITVLTGGFEYQGKVYRSLSAIARAITGSNWNGYKFFNLIKD
jgi:hypothetical protein